ncbi:MAG TPA: hypothetical protein DGG95_07570 [Cytophagales bacterium]|jgi:hypothetical protein|nr:hypothetical protein [Cytophagales bacterium]
MIRFVVQIHSKVMRILFFINCLLVLAHPVFSQLKRGQVDPKKVPLPSQHYSNEFTFDSPTRPEVWKKETKGMNVSFASTNELYLRSEIPVSTPSLSWEDIGWQGERLNSQIVVWSPDTVNQIRFSVSDLTDGSGHTITNDNITVNLIHYVLSNFPYGATQTSCDASATDTAYLMPDRFETLNRFDLPGRTTRPIWMSVNIPRGIYPSTYQGTIKVSSNKEEKVLSVKIKVQSQTLPSPHDWKFRLDLWQNPSSVAEYFQVEPWSAEHIAFLRKHLKLYADAGGTYITTYAVHSPWADNSYHLEGGMIEWIKKSNGEWKFDYSIFDQYVTLSMETGIDRAITIYTPVPWGYRFRIKEEVTGNNIYEVWPPESNEFNANWKIFLDDLRKHLEQKGWFKKTYLGINENPLAVTLATIKVIKTHSKDWKITYAGDWHAELTDLIDDYSPIIGKEPNLNELKARKEKGMTTTYYVCCTPPRPNNFLFSPPAEGRYISWYSAAYGYNGFLRWAYDAWPEDPLRDARHTFWPAGDCFLVYPGGNSSIRFEKLREGIIDFEKIRILKELASKSSNKNHKALIKTLDDHLSLFIDSPDYNKRNFTTEKIDRLVNDGGKILNKLSDELTH